MTPRRPGEPGRAARLAELPDEPRRRSGEDGAPDDRPIAESVSLEQDGAFVTVVLSRPSADRAGARERKRLRLTTEQCAALHVRKGPVPPERAEAWEEADALCGAILRGLSLLRYGDLSARRLIFKLTARGVTREKAEEAAAYLREHGFLDEGTAAARRAERNAAKLWGPRRIQADLRAQGYGEEAVRAAMDALDEAGVDFTENCAAAIRRFHAGAADDPIARRKTYAALSRLGYGADTIRAARQLVR